MPLFWKDTVTYVDALHEWRGTMMNIPWRGDAKLLDRVWVTKTLYQSSHSHPWSEYPRNDTLESVEGIIIGLCTEHIFAKKGYTDKSTIDGWVYNWIQSDWESIRFKNQWWEVLLRSGTVINAHTIKKSHGEFQEVFDHMQVWEQKKKLLEEAQQKYTDSLADMESHLKKGKEFQTKMIQSITGK